MPPAAVLLVEVQADTRQAEAALQRTGRELDATKSKAEKAGGGFSGLGKQLGLTREDMVRGAAAAVGLGAGLSIAATAADLLHQTIKQAAIDNLEAARVARVTTLAYGIQASGYTQFAQALSQQTNFTKEAILGAAISARTLSQNYGLNISQTQKLITVAADLARVKGITLADAFERVQSGVRGEAEASEALGIVINDTYMKNQASNGSFRLTWETMTDTAKAQARYNEILKQSAQFQGLAASTAGTAEDQYNRLGTAVHNVSVGLGGLVNVIGGFFAKGYAAQIETYITAWNDFTTGVNNARTGVEDLTESLLNLPAPMVDTLFPGWREGQAQAAAARRGARTLDRDKILAGQERKDTDDELQARQERARRQGLLSSTFGIAGKGSPTLLDDQRKLVDDMEGRGRGIDLENERAQLGLRQQLAQAEEDLIAPRQRLADLQREINDLTRDDLNLRRQVLTAQQAALPASRALEDADFRTRQLQLQIAAERQARRQGGTLGYDIQGNRQALRGLGRQRAGLELAALESGRPLTLAQRAEEDARLRGQLAAIPLQAQAQGLQSIVDKHEAARDAIQRQIDGVQRLGQAYKDAFTKDLLDAQQRLLDIERERADLEKNRGTNAPGSGAGLRSLKEGGDDHGYADYLASLGGGASGGTSNGANITLAPTITVTSQDKADYLTAMSQMWDEAVARADGQAPPNLPGNL